MAATTLTERYAPNLHGVLSCYDRLIVTGTLPGACYAGGMTSFLYSRGIRIFDYPKFAEPLRDRIRQRAQEVCDANGVSIEHVNKSHIRKEDLVARVRAVRGDAPGLVHVLSAMESCPSYKPWLDKSNGHVFLLLLLHRRRIRSVLPARANLGAVRVAVLLQRPQRLGVLAQA
jgi:hypothetical protein